ncbi:MAG: alpha/beta fold hydrolase, partial [Flavobacteriales bacterium]
MERPAIVFLHGFPHDGGLWHSQVARFAPHRRVLAPDMRGFGRDRRPLPAAMTMEAYAEDARALMDAEGIGRAVLCGLSMGGSVALAFAERWPERLSGLVLCNTRAP